MKKNSKQLLLIINFVFGLLLASLGAFSQTISYEYASLGSSCNVFASPVVHQGYSHKTNLGFPSFVGSPDYYISMQTANYTSSERKATQYSIVFNFKAGYTYSIKVYGAATSSNYTPMVGLKLSTSDGGSNSSTNCTGPEPFPVSDEQYYSKGPLSTSWAWTSNLINNVTLTQNYGYLLVAALPYPNMTGTQTIKIRKIQILESDPPFTLSPTTVPVNCGSPVIESFNVYNPNNVSGVTGYTWNLGPSNGWLYNGSAAPSSIFTTTSTLQLSATCATSLLSNVSVTVDVKNQPNTTLTSNVSFSTSLPSSFQFNGLGYACTQSPVSSNYSLYDEPCNATVSWSASPSGMVTLSPNGNTVDVTPVTNASGIVTLTASVTNSCNATGSFTKSISLDNSGCLCMGGPTGLYDDVGPYGSGTRNLYWNTLPGVGSYSIEYRYGSPSVGGTASGTPPYQFFHQPGQTFEWRVRGVCSNGYTGYSSWASFVMPRAIFDQGSEEADFSGVKLFVYPVPANKKLNLSFGSTQELKGDITIMDMLGKTIIQKGIIIAKGLNLQTIDVADLANGIYFVKIQLNGKLTTRKFLVQK